MSAEKARVHCMALSLQLLRFVQKTCLRMIESKSDEVPEVWMALCFAALVPHQDLDLRFRKLLLDDPDMPVDQFLRGTLDILQLAIDRLQACDQTELDGSLEAALEGLTKESMIHESRESLTHVGRSLLVYLEQEAGHMLLRSDYECLPMWEDLLWISLTLMSRTHKATETLPCLNMAPDEIIRVGLDVIRDVLYRRKAKHDPWGLKDIECSA